MIGFRAKVANFVHSGSAAQRRVRLFGVALALLVLFSIPQLTHAAFYDTLFELISGVLYFLINQLGKLTVLLFGVLVQVAQYNDFINSPAVTIGWRVLRDVANMLFILVLLVISFGTAFRIQTYRYNSLLRQLIIMAVLINFSKLITGFFIDFSQVIMLTFVNAFADTAAGNLTTALHLDKVLALDTSVPGDEITSLSVAGTLLLGLIMIAATTVVTFLYVVIFAGRIIALWILTILSPMAYLLSTFPSTRSYYSQWWRKFWQYAMVGPVLAFFLWLSLTITAGGNAIIGTNANTNSGFESGGRVSAAISVIGSQAGILSFLVSMMLLIFSLKTAADFSVTGGSWAASKGQAAQKALIRGATALPRSLGGRAAEGAARGGSGWLAAGATAATRIPLAGRAFSPAARRLTNWNAQLESRRQKDIDKRSRKDEVKNIRNVALIRQRLSAPARTDADKAQQRHLRRLNPALVPNTPAGDATFQAELQKMSREDWNNLDSGRKKEVANRLNRLGTDMYGVAPQIAGAIAQNAPDTEQRLFGVSGMGWDNKTRQLVDRATGANVPMGTPLHMDLSAVPNPGAFYLSDIDKKKFENTNRAIPMGANGKRDMDAFYASPAYQLGKEQYLSREDFETAERAQRGYQKLSELTGVNSAKRKAAAGGPVDLAMDFAEGEAMGLMLGNAAGANLSGAQQQVAAGVLSEKYRQQQEEKEVDARWVKLRAEADRESEELRLAAAKRGEVGSITPREISRDEAMAAVKSDADFQRSLEDDTEEFRSALQRADSIRLINKGRTGRSARQVLRHEQAHDQIEELDQGAIDNLWGQLLPERQKEIAEYIRANWANGRAMSMQDIQKEFFTEAYSSYGRSEKLGPLALSQDVAVDQNIIAQLDASLAQGKLEKSKREVDRMPEEGLRALYEQIPAARREEIATYIRENKEDGKQFSDDDVVREFFSQALAAHRGGSVDGPLTLTDDEQELALLLHATAKGKGPAFVATPRPASATTSVNDERRRPPTPTIVAPPSGSSRIVAPPAVRVVERKFDAPVSPIIQTNVIQNTTVQSMANDLSKKISGKIDSLPNRQDLLYNLQQLQSAISQVTREQGLADKEIQSLVTELDQLKADVRSPSQRTQDDRQILANMQQFLKKFRNANIETEPTDTNTP